MKIHKFGILKSYTLGEPINIDKLENVTEINEEFLIYLSKYLINLKTYNSKFQENNGLNLNDITIIKPRAAMFLYDMVTTANQFRKSTELTSLAAVLLTAKMNEEYIIHYS